MATETLQAKIQSVQSDPKLSDQQKASIIANLNAMNGSSSR
jgi:hypothetical protein